MLARLLQCAAKTVRVKMGTQQCAVIAAQQNMGQSGMRNNIVRDLDFWFECICTFPCKETVYLNLVRRYNETLQSL